MNIFKSLFIKIADVLIAILSFIYSLPLINKNNSDNDINSSKSNSVENNINNSSSTNVNSKNDNSFDFNIVNAINDFNRLNNDFNNSSSNNNNSDKYANAQNNPQNANPKGFVAKIISKITDNYSNENTDINKFKSDYANTHLNNSQNKGFLDKYADFYKKINLKIFIPISSLIITVLFIVITFIIGIEIAILMLLLIFMGIFLIIRMPKMKKERSYTGVSNDLPYLLRQMVTELKSGKGLHDTMLAISNSDYGVLSFEFSRVLEEIKYGESTENALIHMANRVKSESLNRAVTQIIGTLRVGGDLSNTLNVIADDVSHDLQMKLKDYSQKLNAFVMLYTFLAILGPVIILIMVMAASTVMGDIVPPSLILVMYIVFFPMIVAFMGYMIKRLEPKL